MADDGQEIVVTGSPTARPEEELTLIVGGAELAGWEEISLTLRLEGFPNEFSVGLSNAPGGHGAGMLAGAPCRVLLGNDPVVSGYIDTDSITVDEEQHKISVTGRGRTSDLVDCSAEWPTGQIIQGTVVDVATKLATPYSIAVKLGDGADPGPQIPLTALTYGESPAEIIQRLARNAGLLAYEDAEGSLILGTAGTRRAASGATYGVNVQEYEAIHSMQERMSDIVCTSHSMDAYGDQGTGSYFFAHKTDPNVPRHRLRYLTLEQVVNPFEFTEKKAQWEINRAAARSTALRVTVDSWRDSAGALWLPNTIIPVTIPGFRGPSELCIGEVTFQKSNDSGTTAEIFALPSYGFTPEPLNLLPLTQAGIR